MDLHRRLPLIIALALILCLILPLLSTRFAPDRFLTTSPYSEQIHERLSGWAQQSEVGAFLTELGVFPSLKVCAGGNCQAWYCDLVIAGQCFQRLGDGSYAPTNPVGCVGNCNGGTGVCNVGQCSGNGQPYNCCARSGAGGCGPVLMGVRGSDCCGFSPPTPITPLPTPTPPPCDGERIDLRPPVLSYTQEPAHAVVVGQDPRARGFTLNMALRAGQVERWQMRTRQVCSGSSGFYPADCPDGPWRWACLWELAERHHDPITKVEVAMRLGDDTVRWIENDLARRFPGASRSEPLPQIFTVWQGRTLAAEVAWDYLPSDPGIHGGRILITTAGTTISEPQQKSIPFEVHVHLKDTTLWRYE